MQEPTDNYEHIRIQGTGGMNPAPDQGTLTAGREAAPGGVPTGSYEAVSETEHGADGDELNGSLPPHHLDRSLVEVEDRILTVSAPHQALIEELEGQVHDLLAVTVFE